MTVVAYLLVGALITVLLQNIADRLMRLRPFFHPEEHIQTQDTTPTVGWRRVKSRLFQKGLFEMAFDIIPDLNEQRFIIGAQWRFARLDSKYFELSFMERLSRAFLRKKRPYKDVSTPIMFYGVDRDHAVEIMRSYWRKCKRVATANLHMEITGPDMPPSIPMRYLSFNSLFRPKAVLRRIEEEYNISDVSLIEARHKDGPLRMYTQKSGQVWHSGKYSPPSDESTEKHEVENSEEAEN